MANEAARVVSPRRLILRIVALLLGALRDSEARLRSIASAPATTAAQSERDAQARRLADAVENAAIAIADPVTDSIRFATCARPPTPPKPSQSSFANRSNSCSPT